MTRVAMEPSGLPTLIAVSLLCCCSHDRPPTGSGSPATPIDGNNAHATAERQRNVLNSIFCGASLSLVTAFVVVSTLPPSLFVLPFARKSLEENTTPQHLPTPCSKPCSAANETDSKSTLFHVPEVVDLSVQFRHDDNSFVLSSSCYSASDALVPRTRKPTPVTTRRQRRAQETSTCNYSDFCDNDLTRQIEAMVLEVETAYANRGTKNTQDIAAQPSIPEYLFAQDPDQAVNADTTVKVITDDAHVHRAKNSYPQDTDYSHNNKSLHILRQIFNKNLKDDVPAMRMCDDSMSLSSDYSFSTRSSLETLSTSPTKRLRNLSPQPNAEWSIIE